MQNDQVLVLENFYEDLNWLKDDRIVRWRKQTTPEETFHLNPSHRYKLLEKVSALFPKTFYPTDSGWIRSNFTSEEKPMATSLHSDAPYLVLSVCLSSPEKEDHSYGTTFCRHHEFGFTKIDSPVSRKIFQAHREEDQKWIPYLKTPFKRNTAIVYNGALFHKMPWPVFGTSLEDSRLIQIFNFRVKEFS